MIDHLFCQLSGLVPPAKDGVADAVYKLHTIFQNQGVKSYIVTSIDNLSSENTFPIVRKWSLWQLNSLRSFFLEKGIRTIIFHYPSPKYSRTISLSFVPLVWRLYGIKTIVYLHEFTSYSWMGKLRIVILLFGSQKVITTDSRNFHRLKKLRIFDGRLYYQPTGANIIPPPLFLSEKKHPQKETIDVLYFGLIRREKGITALLDAFQHNEEIRKKFRFHVVGGLPERYGAGDIELLHRIQSSNDIIYHGFVYTDELGTIFETIDVVFLPFEDGVTERRGSFMTGMAFGKPVFTTRPEYPIKGLIDNDNVVFLESSYVGSIKAAFETIVSMNPLALRLIGKRARQWYNENFSDDVLYRNLAEIISQ